LPVSSTRKAELSWIASTCRPAVRAPVRASTASIMALPVIPAFAGTGLGIVQKARDPHLAGAVAAQRPHADDPGRFSSSKQLGSRGGGMRGEAIESFRAG
jgi:hypothetical protein